MIEWLKQFCFKKIEPVSDAEWASIINQLEYLQKLDIENDKKLRTLVNELLGLKVISTASNKIDRSILLPVVAQASILVLNLGSEWLSAWDKVELSSDKKRLLINGQQSIGGSYLAVLSGIIDSLDGEENGIPPLHSSINKTAWQETFFDAYKDFKFRVQSGPENEILFDKVATKNLASFFAIMTDVFFTAPDMIRCAYPDVYESLVLFYRQNPAIQQNMNTKNTYSSLFKK